MITKTIIADKLAKGGFKLLTWLVANKKPASTPLLLENPTPEKQRSQNGASPQSSGPHS